MLQACAQAVDFKAGRHFGEGQGTNVYYSVSDTTLFQLLDVAKDIFNNHLVGVRDMLQQIEAVP